MSTGISAVSGELPSLRQTSKPSMPGSMRSSSTREGFCSLAMARPVTPSTASMEVNPSFSRLKCSRLRMSASSSITRMVPSDIVQLQFPVLHGTEVTIQRSECYNSVTSPFSLFREDLSGHSFFLRTEGGKRYRKKSCNRIAQKKNVKKNGVSSLKARKITLFSLLLPDSGMKAGKRCHPGASG